MSLWKKGILALGLCVALAGSSNASFSGLVNRSATTDTISIPFWLADSLGQPVNAVTTTDSFYLIIFSPGGVEVFTDSGLLNASSITEGPWEDAGNVYSYKNNVANLDGSSTSDGVFSYIITVDDASLSLETTFRGTFQIINDELATILDSVGLAAVDAQVAVDSLQAQDDWVAKRDLQESMLGHLGFVSSNIKIKYVDSAGDNSNGDSWATAYTSLDGFNAVTDSSFEYIVLVSPFRDSAVNCTAYVPNTKFYFSPGYVGLNTYESDASPAATDYYWMTIQADNVELYGNGATLIADTVRDSALSPDWADAGQTFPGAIKLDSAKNAAGAANDGADDVIIDGFYFKMGHKPVVLWPDLSDVSSLHDRTHIRNCTFERPKWHAIDGRGRDIYVYDNKFLGRASSELTPTSSVEVIANSHRWFIYDNQQIGGAKIVESATDADSVLCYNNVGNAVNDEFYTAAASNDFVKWISPQTYDVTWQRDHNLLSNGSFEEFDGPRFNPTDWTTDGADRQGTWLQYHAHGNYSFFLNGASDTAYARSEPIYLTSSETYQLSGQIYATSAGQEFKAALIPYANVTTGDTTVIDSVTATNGQWDSWSFTVTPPTSELFHVVVYADADLVYIDNLQLTYFNYAQQVIDSLQAQDDWIAHQTTSDSLYDSLAIIRDSLLIVLDSLEALESWVATTAKQTLIIDTVNGIIDTLQNQDNWVATSANQTLIIDTVNGIIDTLQVHDTRWDSVLAATDDHAVAEKVWGHAADTGWAAGTFGDSAKGWGATAASSFDPATDSVIVDVSAALAGLIDSIARISADSLLGKDTLANNGAANMADSQRVLAYWISPVSYVSIGQVRDTFWATDSARFDDSTHQMGGALLSNLGSVSLSAATQAQIDSIETALAHANIRAKVWWADTLTYGDSTLTMGFMLKLNDTSLFVSLGNIPDTLAKDVSYQDTIKSIVDDTLKLAHGDSSWTGTETSGGGAATDTTAIRGLIRTFLSAFPDGGNLVENANFERDSGNTAEAWGLYTGEADSNKTWTATSESRGWVFRLRPTTTAGDTIAFRSRIGYLPTGLYELSVKMSEADGGQAIAGLIAGSTPPTEDFIDSIQATSATFMTYSKIVTVDTSGDVWFSIMLVHADTGDEAFFDEASLRVVTLDTSTYQGDGTNIIADAYWDSVANRADSGAAAGSGATAQEVMDSLLAQLVSDTVTGTYLADLLNAIDKIRDSVQYLVTGGSGTGANTVQIGATDTSGTDTLVSGIRLTVRDIAGNLIGSPQVTNSGGFAAFNLDADTFTVQVHSIVQNDHIWPAGLDTFVVATNPDSFYVGNGDTVAAGYDFGVGVPATANLSRVFINGLADAEGNYLSGAQITAILRGINLIDTSTNQPISAHRAVSALTDTLGYTFIDLQKTVLLNQDVGYTITVTKGRDIILQIDGFSVPDQDSVRISP